MAKKIKGDGSFRKKKDSYEYRTYIEKPNGDILQKSFSAKTQRECKEKAKAYKKSLEIIVAEEYTLNEWATQWLEVYKKGTVTTDTYNSYACAIKILLNHKIAKIQIDKIKPINIQSFFNDIKDKSLSTQKKLRFMLNAIFETAIENELCFKNPMTNIKLTSNTVEKREAFSEKEIETIVSFCKIHEFGNVIMLLLFTGLRRGELLALTWNCYDKKNKILTVNGTLTLSDGIKAGSANNKNHNRQIPLPIEITNILDNMTKKGMYVVDYRNSYMPIYAFRTRYDDFFKCLDEWCEKNEIEKVRKLTTHSFRHTYGTMLYRKGIDLKTIQTLLGHSSIDITANIYTHTDIEVSKQAVVLAFGS